MIEYLTYFQWDASFIAFLLLLIVAYMLLSYWMLQNY